MTNSKLPDKPSELIRMALQDLIKCEQNRNYVVDMWYYHVPADDKCLVCFAGSVMAQTLECSRYLKVGPTDWGNDAKCKLYALNSFRLYDIFVGLEQLGIEPTDANYKMYVDYIDEIGHSYDYEEDKDKFKSNMRLLADKFEGVGL